ncbi:flavin monoamine oxidase family protein [Roseateles sp. P5_D6]
MANRQMSAARASPQQAPAAQWPNYKRVRELIALYGGAGVPRVAGAPPRVAVVGAGIAGLVAAHLLTLGGCRPRVFDAAETVGGRIRTDHGQLAPGVVTELGGELVDTTHADMIALARSFGCTPIDTEARSEAGLAALIHVGGRSHSRDEAARAFQPFVQRIARDAASLSTRVGRRRHTELDVGFDRLSIDDYLDRIGLDGWLRQRICSGYTTLNGLDSWDQSSINLLQRIGVTARDGFSLFGSSDERWKVAEGLDCIVQGLVGSLKAPALTGHRLVRVARRGSSLLLEFETAGRVVSYEADAVVLALPFTMLRQVEAPGVFSEAKARAIRELAYGTNSKVMVGTRRRLWREKGSSGDVITDGVLQCGWDGSRLRPGEQGVFTYFLGGRNGLDIGQGSTEAQVRRLNAEAEALWPGFEAACTGCAVRVHWPSEPWAQGSYSTYRPGQRTSLAGDEATPDREIYFVGEHCSVVWQGYMQGAASTGRQAALAILRRMA